jgi:2,3-dihydroxybenzoate decarboxylase
MVMARIENWHEPKAAADELERTTTLGFKGAMIHGLANGAFLDDKQFWPIFERAQLRCWLDSC